MTRRIKHIIMQSQSESREVLIHEQARNHIWSEETGWARKEVLVLEGSKAERWVQDQIRELRLKRILKMKAISRLQREISEIDCLLSKYEVVE